MKSCSLSLFPLPSVKIMYISSLSLTIFRKLTKSDARKVCLNDLQTLIKNILTNLFDLFKNLCLTIFTIAHF